MNSTNFLRSTKLKFFCVLIWVLGMHAYFMVRQFGEKFITMTRKKKGEFVKGIVLEKE